MNIDNLKKKILYRSEHRGTKEMDLLLGKFVKKFINYFDKKELEELESLLNVDDEILFKWLANHDTKKMIPSNNITKKLKEFKL